MFALIVSTVLASHFLIFPIVSINTFAIQDLTEMECNALVPAFTKEDKDGGFLYSSELTSTAKCVKIK